VANKFDLEFVLGPLHIGEDGDVYPPSSLGSIPFYRPASKINFPNK